MPYVHAKIARGQAAGALEVARASLTDAVTILNNEGHVTPDQLDRMFDHLHAATRRIGEAQSLARRALHFSYKEIMDDKTQ